MRVAFRGGLALAVLMLWAPLPGHAAPATANVTYVITNGGADVKDKGQVHFVAHGDHGGATVQWSNSGEAADLPAGTYDVHVNFGDGAATKDFWIDNQAFSGKVLKKVEVNLPVAAVTFTITNGGADAGGKGEAHFFTPGNHNDPVDWVRSGGTSRLPAGRYDVHVTFSDGSANKDLWIENQAFSGNVKRTVEVGVSIAEVTYHITNGGADAGGKGEAHFYAAGNHDDPVDWVRSGASARLPAGHYDVHVTFADGQAKKDVWLNDQAFAGTVDKTVEMGVAVANVAYVIVNFGTELKDKAQVHFVVHGNHNGDTVERTLSGGTARLAAGAYDVQVTYDDGLVHKQVWLDNQIFSGTVQKTVDLKLALAQPTVTVTENGASVGDKAVVDYLDPTDTTDFGTAKSGETALIAQGTYDIHAWLGVADGWLRKQAVSGKPQLTLAIASPRIATLTAGAPPPKACAIEVYGVNFDFNKAMLRPDSEPVLKQVQALFTGTPSFAAEVSGHTDNIGTPAYNLTLSDARAAAVKAWLVQHGVAATRVTSRGYGDTRPLVPNTTDANRFKNRRVELRRTNCT